MFAMLMCFATCILFWQWKKRISFFNMSNEYFREISVFIVTTPTR